MPVEKLFQQIQMQVEKDILINLKESRNVKRLFAVVDPEVELSIREQCEILEIIRNILYYKAFGESTEIPTPHYPDKNGGNLS